MVGLNGDLLKNLDPNLALNRILYDTSSDFIFAPHLKSVYAYVGNTLWDGLKRQLSAGTYEPKLPLYIDVPKPSGVTRPGAILLPSDRLLYQILIDYIGPIIENSLDRSRVFSNKLLIEDPNFEMFRNIRDCRTEFDDEVNKLSSLFEWTIKTDIAAYFDTIYHHPLINSLRSIGCPSEAINPLEELLLAWRERKSYGIIQGLSPSDILGNFYLNSLDYKCKLRGIASLRFVDDIYLFFKSKKECLKTLTFICDHLRKEGLFLNEGKTYIKTSEQLVHEETEFDQLLFKVQEQLKDKYFETSYGFQTDWDADEESKIPEIEGHGIDALEQLYKSHDKANWQKDKIIKFCLPILARADSEIAVEDSFSNIVAKPHLTKVYCSYLASVGRTHKDISDRLCDLVLGEELIYEWQYMWVYASLLYQGGNIQARLVDFSLNQLLDRRISEALRAICALIVGKHGSAPQKRTLKLEYSNESSEYVKGAILYCARFLPSDERRACFRAWGGHSTLNSLIVQSCRNSNN